MACHVFIFAIASKPGHTCDNETRVVFQENFCWGQAEPFKDAGAEWVDQYVRGCEKAEENISRFRVAEIKCN